MRFDPTGPDDGTQRVEIVIDVIPGPLTEALAGRLLNVVTNELLDAGADVTTVAVKIHGHMAAW
jgi:hypothetical protein